MKPIYTKLITAVLSTALLCTASLLAEPIEEAAATTDTLQAFQLSFQLKGFGLSAATEIRLEPTTTPNEYQYSNKTQALGLARLIRPNPATETSRFLVHGDTLQVEEYQFDAGNGDKLENSSIRFDWDTDTAYSNHKNESAELPLTAGMLDRMSTDLKASLDLQAGRRPQTYTMVYRNSARTYHFEYHGEEQVTTPAGTFATVKYLQYRDDSSRATHIWYAPELQYQPVKVVQLKRGKTNGTLLLTAYHFGPEVKP